MEPSHPLKVLLQLQLATDSSAAVNLPYVLSILTEDCFQPSPHLLKWTTRINSLLHSKDPAGRWAGLCVAHATSVSSRTTMITCAQSWMGVALPMLSKNESTPVLKGATRLLSIIFSACLDVPEFQRQVAMPNIQKFTTAIIGIAERHKDVALKVLILDTITKIIPLYPTSHRASHSALSSLSFRFLNGSVPAPTQKALLESASRLYAVLHLTGGKVGAANLWKKSIDETLAFGWSAFLAIRSTFTTEGQIHQPVIPTGEPAITIPLHLDRLRCCIVVLRDLLSSTTYRPVLLPIGALVKFASTLLSCSKDHEAEGHLNPTVRVMEASITPDIWKLSCDLVVSLAKCARHHLTPYLTRLVLYLTFHLEQKPTTSLRLPILEALQALLTGCHPMDAPLITTRLAKAVLPSLTVILTTQSRGQPSDTPTTPSSRKEKKRARGYEGDEVFKLSREVICPHIDDGKVLLITLEVLHVLLRNPNLSQAMQSITARVVLSLLLALPQMSPASLSPDLSFHGRLLQQVQALNIELGSGINPRNKNLGLIIRTTVANGFSDVSGHNFDILLHPRVPPLVRPLPHAESLSLFCTEEPQEETELREGLGLATMQQAESTSTQGILVEELETTPQIEAVPKSSSSNIPILVEPPLAGFTPPTTSTIPPGTTNKHHIPALTSGTGQSRLNSSSMKAITQEDPSPLPPILQPRAVIAGTDDDEEDMPPIDIDSDSDVDY